MYIYVYLRTCFSNKIHEIPHIMSFLSSIGGVVESNLVYKMYDPISAHHAIHVNCIIALHLQSDRAGERL